MNVWRLLTSQPEVKNLGFVDGSCPTNRMPERPLSAKSILKAAGPQPALS